MREWNSNKTTIKLEDKNLESNENYGVQSIRHNLRKITNNTNSIAIYTSPSHFHVLPTSNLKFIKVTNKAVSITHYDLTSKKKKKKLYKYILTG